MPLNPITGTDDDDNLQGTDQRDLIHGLPGDDWIVTAGGHDTVFGDAGNDSVFAYFGDEVLFGGDGDDQLVTSNFDSDQIGRLYGGAGNDRIFAGDRVDHSHAGAGDDTLTVYFHAGGEAYGGTGTDTLFVSLFFVPADARVIAIATGSDAGVRVGTEYLMVTGFEALQITTLDADDYVRGGALGDVPVEVVIAAEAFFPADVVRKNWAEGRAVMQPYDAALAFAGYCADFTRTRVPDVPARVVGLLERVVDGAEPLGLPLFAAWRALPRPDDAPGRLGLLANVLREHRGSVHAAAVAAGGMHPLAAVCAGSYGEANARFFEWPEPDPDPAVHRADWQRAEALTCEAAARPYAVLTGAERTELVDVLTALLS